jgi:hypothetical protein
VKRSDKTFISFHFEAKQSEKTFISVCFEAKRKIFGSETKRKYAVLISLRSEAKISKRKEAEKMFHVSVRNACETDLVSFEAKNFFLRNRRTLRSGWIANEENTHLSFSTVSSVQ